MLEANKLRIVRVETSLGVLSDTAYDDGSKLYKIEDDLVHVSCMPLAGHRSDAMKTSMWKVIANKEYVKKISILNWPNEELLEEIEL